MADILDDERMAKEVEDLLNRETTASVKRFAAFRGQDYYPAGGWNDFLSAHGTREDAIGALLDAAIESSFGWAHIVDLATGEIVYDTDRDPG